MALLQQFSVQSQSGLVAQKMIFIFKELQPKFGTMPCIWTWKTYLWSFMSIEDVLSEYWQFSVPPEWKQKYMCVLHNENRCKPLILCMLNIIEVEMVLIHQPNEKDTSDILLFIVIYYSFIQQMNGNVWSFSNIQQSSLIIHPMDEQADSSTGHCHLVHSDHCLQPCLSYSL